MRGLLVLGLSHGASEGAVAAAVGAVARRAQEPVDAVRAIALGDRDADALYAFDAIASPVTAARHQGADLDPAQLAAELAGHADGHTLIASVPAGVLAAITTRFTIRDLAA